MNSLLRIPKPFDRFQQLNAPRAVKRVARQDDEPAPKGRGGRPRKDAERDVVARLRSEGKSWKQIAKTINQETGQNKSQDAYRRLMDRNRRPKKDQNSVLSME